MSRIHLHHNFKEPRPSLNDRQNLRNVLHDLAVSRHVVQFQCEQCRSFIVHPHVVVGVDYVDDFAIGTSWGAKVSLNGVDWVIRE